MAKGEEAEAKASNPVRLSAFSFAGPELVALDENADEASEGVGVVTALELVLAVELEACEPYGVQFFGANRLGPLTVANGEFVDA